MYLAKFRNGDTELNQAIAWTTVADEYQASQFSQSISNLFLSSSSFAIRTSLTEGKVERFIFFNADQNKIVQFEDELQRLETDNRIHSAEFTPDKESHDSIAHKFPALHVASMRPGAYRAGDYRLASDFRLKTVIDQFFDAATHLKWNIAYQINACQYLTSTEDRRYLRKQLARMELDSGVPTDLVQLQKNIVSRIDKSCMLIDEFIACGDEQSWDHLNELIEDQFVLSMTKYGFAESPLEPLSQELVEETVVTGFQTEILENSDPVTRAAAALPKIDFDRTFQWLPAISTTLVDVNTPPRTSDGRSGYDVFISYSSRNKNAATEACAHLERLGLRCWIAPRNVLPGKPYPAEIARALRSSKTLVLLLSKHSNVSPHVQREVERAVGNDAPIVTLELETVELTDALEYLISLPHSIRTQDPPTEVDMQRVFSALTSRD